MRRSASEIISNLERRIARLENQRTAGYPQGYFDTDMYDAERSYYEDDSKTFKDDYFDRSDRSSRPNPYHPLELLKNEIRHAVREIGEELHKLQKFDYDNGDFIGKTFDRYVKYDSKRNSFKLSGGDDDRTKRVLMQGRLRDGSSDPFFKLTLEDARVDRKGQISWTIGCHMMFMSNDVYSHYINKGFKYRTELENWLDL